jgi:hypothetical protein
MSRVGTLKGAVDEMRADLDALREGLAEAETLTRDDWDTAPGL